MNVTEVTLEWARNNFADIVNAVKHRHETVVITRYGKPYVKLAPLSDLPEQPQLRQIGDGLHHHVLP